ncbi:BofC C-terminal domain-containing protein [Pueribacillus sp. YX66]|uniref:BofC C-terminal domain-containing protein n=1 Tax=Pueribacillus sp. YX66 TaxID=3229242 RepID=UPI00358CEBC8
MLQKALISIVLFFFAVVSPFAHLSKAKNVADQVEVHLVREYLDGERSIEVVNETVNSISDIFLIYQGWELVDHNDHYVKLYKKIQDISPLLKTNGYFGLSGNGILTIYDGKPSDEKAIQSFYQLDIDKLESNLINKLKMGIPIKTKNDFVTVITKLKRYEK